MLIYHHANIILLLYMTTSLMQVLLVALAWQTKRTEHRQMAIKVDINVKHFAAQRKYCFTT